MCIHYISGVTRISSIYFLGLHDFVVNVVVMVAVVAVIVIVVVVLFVIVK